mgnify:CR=1 FL=1
MGKITAICISEARGTAKREVAQATLLCDWGLEGDAHAGKWHRQVSLLAKENIDEFRARGADVAYGDFGENLVVEGLSPETAAVGTIFRCGQALLELTQIGKQCHGHCAIYERMGDCIMPREGVFCRVLRGGEIRPGDAIETVPRYIHRVAVITSSDSCAAGENTDESGPLAADICRRAGLEPVSCDVLPDDLDALSGRMRSICDSFAAELILTTGGTGFSPRDVTPEATAKIIERPTPGIPEAMRYYSLQKTPRAMLSRAAAGIRGKTLIVNLPGSPKAVEECLGSIMPALLHGLDIMVGADRRCAGERTEEKQK